MQANDQAAQERRDEDACCIGDCQGGPCRLPLIHDRQRRALAQHTGRTPLAPPGKGRRTPGKQGRAK